MSLFQSLEIGVSGMKSQASKLGVISDNISNANTVGYKSANASFKTLVTEISQNQTGAYSPGGVTPGFTQANQRGGTIIGTSSSTDLAITGAGFFPVTATSTSATIMYTRAGSFSKDSAGNFMNANGFYLKGWRLDANGNLPTALSGSTLTQAAAESALQNINVDDLSVDPIPTTEITLKANLNAGASILPNNSITVTGNLQSSQAPLPSSNVAVTGNLKSSQAAYGSTEFQINRLFTQLQGIDASQRQEFFDAVQDLYPTETLPPALLIDQPTLTSFIDAKFGPVATQVQDFLNAVQPNLPATNVLKGYQSAPLPYDATNPTTSMATGIVNPNRTAQLTVYDAAGNQRSLQVSYLKTADNTWAVEIYATNASDVTTTGVPGQLAYGNVTFNADGTLASVDPALVAATSITWNSPSSTSTLTFDFGTVGDDNGLQQLDGSYIAQATATSDYDPTSATTSMSSGTTVPAFSKTVTVVDNTGTTRTMSVNFVKTGANAWGVEITAVPASDITTTGVAGQIAAGTITFANNGVAPNLGQLASISPSLLGPIGVNWTGDDEPNSMQFDWGTINNTNGLKQNNLASSATATVVKNYDPTDDTKNMSSGGVNASFSRTLDVVDDLGNLRTLAFNFLKINNNSWAVEIAAQDAADVDLPTSPLIAHGSVSFDGSGILTSISPSISDLISIPWTATGGTSSIALHLGTAGSSDGLTQVNGAFQVGQFLQNGSVAGEIATITVDDKGIVTGQYANGAVRKLFQIPIADFINEDGLQSINGNVFMRTSKSGEALYFQAHSLGRSSISPSTLESSNVDLPTEMSNLLVAQRAYQSNSKLITTTDSMLDVLFKM